jgi:hypothetical protein
LCIYKHGKTFISTSNFFSQMSNQQYDKIPGASTSFSLS